MRMRLDAGICVSILMMFVVLGVNGQQHRVNPQCPNDSILCISRKKDYCIAKFSYMHPIMAAHQGRSCLNQCDPENTDEHVACPTRYDSKGCKLPPRMVPRGAENKFCPNIQVNAVNGCILPSRDCNPTYEMQCQYQLPPKVQSFDPTKDCPPPAHFCQRKFTFKGQPPPTAVALSIRATMCINHCPPLIPRRDHKLCPPTYDEKGCPNQVTYIPPDKVCPKSQFDINGCPIVDCDTKTNMLCNVGHGPKCPKCIPKLIPHPDKTNTMCENRCAARQPPNTNLCPPTYDKKGCAMSPSFYLKTEDIAVCNKSVYTKMGCEILEKVNCSDGQKKCGGGKNASGCDLKITCIEQNASCPN